MKIRSVSTDKIRGTTQKAFPSASIVIGHTRALRNGLDRRFNVERKSGGFFQPAVFLPFRHSFSSSYPFFSFSPAVRPLYSCSITRTQSSPLRFSPQIFRSSSHLFTKKKKVENVLISTNFESNIFFTRNFLTIKF